MDREKFMPKFIVVLMLALCCKLAIADIYSCKDASGKSKFQDKPCDTADKTVSVKAYENQAPLEESNADVAKAKELVQKTLLFQPEKARFRKFKTVEHKDGLVVCGEVDSLNLAGQYLGYKKFAVQNDDVTWVNNLAKNAGQGGFANSLRREYERTLDKYLKLGCPNY